MPQVSRFKSLFPIVVSLVALTGLFFVFAPVAAAQVARTTLGGNEQSVWDFVANREGIVNLWRLSLGLVDLVVVAGLIIAAFSNIFRINIKAYEIKQVLPGLIIGIILANLSFFIMRVFFDGATILTQTIGDITVHQLDSSSGLLDRSAGKYLIDALTGELGESVLKFPSTITNLSTAGGIGVLLGSSLGIVSVLALIFFLLIALAPIILYMILIFLLYMRNYILVVMFIISPLAFFALGYPPFRSWWQKWWGTFWKWLLMAPIVHVLLAFATIFLHYANKNVGTGDRGVGDYLFVNGVALALMYFSARIPFIWGSFFGIVDMKNWSQAGKYAGTKGSNFAWDRAARSGATIQSRLHPHAGEKSRIDLDRKIIDLRRKNPQLSSPQAENIIRKQYGNDQFDKFASRSPIRQAKGGLSVYKAYTESLEKREDYLSTRSPVHDVLKKRLDFKGYADNQAERFKKEFDDNEDTDELFDEFEKLRNALIAKGLTQTDAGALLRKGINTTNFAKFLQGNSVFDDMKTEDVIKQLVAGKQLRKAITLKFDKTVAKDKLRDVLDSGTRPYAPGGGDGADGSAGGGGPSGGGSGGGGRPMTGAAIPVAISHVAENAFKHVRFSSDEKDVLTGFPGTTKAHFDEMYTNKHELGLQQALAGMNMTDDRVKTVMATLRARAQDPNSKDIGRLREYGPEFEGLGDDQKVAVAEQMHNYGRAMRARQALIYNSIDPDDRIVSAERIANNFSATASPDAAGEKQKLEGMDHDFEALEKVLTGSPTSDGLRQVHQGLAQHNIPVLDIPQPGTTGDNYEVHAQLAQRVEAARTAVTLHQDAITNNVSVKEVVTHRQETGLALQEIMRGIDASQRNLGETISENLAQNIAAQSQNTVKALMTSAPEFNRRDRPVVIDAASINDVAQRIVTPITARLAEKQSQQAGTRAIDMLTSKDDAKVLRTIVQTAMHEAALQHQSLDPQRVVVEQTAAASNTPAPVVVAAQVANEAPSESPAPTPEPVAIPTVATDEGLSEIAAPAPESSSEPPASNA